MAHSYFQTFGISLSGVYKVAYEDGESITFNSNYAGITGYAKTLTWNFYNSTSGALIKTISGEAASTTFTHTEGKNGVDVELIINWGTYQTKFYKRHRMVIMPDCSNPDFTINLSDGASDSYIDDLGGGQYSLNFSMCTGGEIVRLMGNISTIRLQVDNLPNNVANPVVLVINSSTTITKTGTTYDDALRIDDGDPTNGFWIYGKKDGSGNRYFTIDGGGIGTYRADNFSSHNNLRISGVKVINAQSTGIKLKLDNVNRFINAMDDMWVYDNEVTLSDNEGCYIGWEAASGYRFDSTFNTDASFDSTSTTSINYSTVVAPLTITVDTGKSYIAGQGVRIESNSTNYIIGKVSTYNSGTGQLVLTPIDITTSAGATFTSHVINVGDYHHTTKRLKIFANNFHTNGWDGIQCTGSDEDTEIHDNLIEGNGVDGTFAQWFAITAAGGFTGQIYNNIMDDAIQVFVNGDTYIYNNFIRGNTNASINNAMFVRRTDNPGYKGPDGDSYNHCDPVAEFHIFQNIILSVLDNVYILDVNDSGTGSIPISVIRYTNNSLFYSGTPSEGILRYAEPGGTTVVQTPNYLATTEAELKIVDMDTFDVAMLDISPLFLSANEGVDMSLTIDELTLKTGFTDLTGQSVPLRGYWKQTPIQRVNNYIEPDPTETQIQWYQTAQTSVFSDKSKLNDMYGYKVKTYGKITQDIKNLLMATIKPYALTGTVAGVETNQTNNAS